MSGAQEAEIPGDDNDDDNDDDDNDDDDNDQYLDDLILERERANERLRGEMSKFVGWCAMIDQNSVPETVVEALNNGALEPDQGQQS